MLSQSSESKTSCPALSRHKFESNRAFSLAMLASKLAFFCTPTVHARCRQHLAVVHTHRRFLTVGLPCAYIVQEISVVRAWAGRSGGPKGVSLTGNDVSRAVLLRPWVISLGQGQVTLAHHCCNTASQCCNSHGWKVNCRA